METLNGHSQSRKVEDEATTEDTTSKRPSLFSYPKHINKKRKTDSLYVPPTVAEWCNLKETETMFHSSLFRLQVEEMMTELKMKPKVKSKLTEWLSLLKKTLMEMPETEMFDMNDLSWLSDSVKVPLAKQPVIKKKASFCFLSPTKVFETGSFLLDTMCSPNRVIDLALEVPKAFWQSTDHLSHIYHRKRALYLAYLAQSLQNNSAIADLQFGYQGDCHLKPVLILKPSGSLGKRHSIRLLPYPENDAFKLSRFIPERNNVKKAWLLNSTSEQAIPTPFYNSTVLLDLLIPELTDFVKEHIVSDSVKEGIVMLKVWCMQRGIYGHNSMVNGFILTMLVAHLIVKRKVSHQMSSYQVFRNALLALKSQPWSEGLTLNEDKVSDSFDFRKHFDVVFIEKSGFLNICFDLRKESLIRLQHEAEIALYMLDSIQADSFQNLFMTEIPFGRKFEWLFRITNFRKYNKYLKDEESFVDHVGDGVEVFVKKLFKELKMGLEERISLIDSHIVPVSSWSISKSPPKLNSREIVFGINQNQEYAFLNMKKGPLADSPEAGGFQAFWQGLSELRRFKDGSIHEAVVFSAETYHEKRSVLFDMVKYIFTKRLGVREGDINVSGCETDSILQIPTNFQQYNGTGEELFEAVMQSFSALSDDLRKLDKMPLSISSVQGISPIFRFTEVFPPFANTMNKNWNQVSLCVPFESVVHFESSGKWPDDLKAIQRVKAAFHLKMAELLHKKYFHCVKPSIDHIDVLKDGFVFRLKIACRKEIALLKQVKVSEGVVKIQANDRSSQLELMTEILPKMNTVLHGLHQQHNTFGTACRLAKRWLSAQLLHGYINDIILEMIMASIYICPEPYSLPSSSQIAFQRFLSLLCTHNWASNPLIVNFNNDIERSEVISIQSTVSSQRSAFAPMVIITPFDRTGMLWTKDSPNLMLLNRVVAVSEATLKTLESQRTEPSMDVQLIFRPPLTAYDFIIHLKAEQIPNLLCSIDDTTVDKQFQGFLDHRESGEQMPAVGFNPIQCYLQDLKDTFGDFALFFYDTYGGRYIAGIWKPNAFETKSFKVANINGHMISGIRADNTTSIVPNIEALLELFMKYGAGVVKRVEKLVEKWNAA